MAGDPFAPDASEVESFEIDFTGVEAKSIGSGFLPAGKWLCAVTKWETGKANTGTAKIDWYWKAVNYSGNKENVDKTARTTNYLTEKTKEYFRGMLEDIGVKFVMKDGKEKAVFDNSVKGLLGFVVVVDREVEVVDENGGKSKKIFTNGDHVEKVPDEVREAYLRENNVTASVTK